MKDLSEVKIRDMKWGKKRKATKLISELCCPATDAWWVDLLFSLHSTDASFAMDTKCAIKSSCSLSGCHLTEYTDPITVNPASNITLNCTIITGKLARNMTWNQAVQALERVENSTGLSNLVLEQSNSTESGGKYSCRCTTIKLARKCFLIQPWGPFLERPGNLPRARNQILISKSQEK